MTAPNILLLLSDDTNPRYLSAYGGQALTPNIQRLADEGMTLHRAYAASAVCTPSRYNYLTGRYAGHCQHPKFRRNFPEDAPYAITWNVYAANAGDNMAYYMKQAGYFTGYVGKMHCGAPQDALGLEPLPDTEDPRDPELNAALHRNQERMRAEMHRLGFDYADRLHWGNLDDPGTPQCLKVHNPEWCTDGALEFLQRTAEVDQPFFLSVATSLIHGDDHITCGIEADPRISRGGYLDSAPECQAPRESIRERLLDVGLPYNHRYAGALWLDDCIGAILARLEDLGELDNTLILYASDHNVFGKGTCYENGVRIPMICRWPDHVPEGTASDSLVQNIDVLPTFMEAAALPRPPGDRLDGKSFLPVLRNPLEEVHDNLYLESGYTRAVVTRNWKYIAFRYPQETIEKMEEGELAYAPDYNGSRGLQAPMRHYPNFWAPDQLYDLAMDPEERINLFDDVRHESQRESLIDLLQCYLVQFDHPYPLDPQPFTRSLPYKKLVERTMKPGPEQFHWYRLDYF